MFENIASASTPYLWIASYPKSGNTWLRFVIFHLGAGRVPYSSKELDSVLNSDFHETSGQNPLLKKTHASIANLSAFHSTTNRAIYIHRHPLDVMQSALNYAALTGEMTAANLSKADDWVDSFIANDGHPLWTKNAPYLAGTWIENVEGWMQEQPFPVLRLIYEDGLGDPVRMIERIANFLEMESSRAEIRRCAEETSFEALKRFEDDEISAALAAGKSQGRFTAGKRLAALRGGVRFFNSGRANSFRTAFRPDQIERAWKVFGPTAGRLGYTL